MRLLPCSQRLSTTWLDHAVSIVYDHIFRSAAWGLTTSCFSLLVFCLRPLPQSWCLDRFLGDHLCFLEVRALTTSLTIVRSGLHGNSSTREHENVRFSWQNSTKKHYLALEKHKNRSWGGRGRKFKSCHSDQNRRFNRTSDFLCIIRILGRFGGSLRKALF